VSTTFLIILGIIVAVAAVLAVQGSGPRVTTIERKTEREEEDGDA
jgi:ABC-type antimicrobial peptide transport system permease subunit